MESVREQRDSLVLRARFFAGIFLAILVVIGYSFWKVQLVQGAEFRELAENNRLRKLPTKAPRGLIYDRDGRVLVENIPSYRLLVDRSRSLDLDSSVAFASRVLEKSEDEVRVAIEAARGAEAFEPALVAADLSLAQVGRFEAKALEHPEFEVEVRHLRLYRYGPQTVHLLGYLGEVNPEEIETADEGTYKPGDLKGKKGIEQIYDLTLRGEDGEQVAVVDSRGRVLEDYPRASAHAGEPLELTLDLELQQAAQRQLEQVEGEHKVGAIVALDPKNGEIRAMVSMPSYDPNILARGITSEAWTQIIETPFNPLQNRTIQNAYSPGSVFKVISAAAALEEGVVGPNDSFYCGGSGVFYGRRFRCWRRQGHGSVDVVGGLKHSCDIYFYTVGQRMGIETLARYSRMFGLGTKTGIDLQGEKSGLVPDDEWSRQARGHRWYPGETISVAIGQGPLLVTPMQIARMTAAIANGGYLVKPHLTTEATPRERPERLPVTEESMDFSRRGMWAVVNAPGGTAGRSRLQGVEMAGKTGTVQVVAQATWGIGDDLPFDKRDHAWFTSFAPADDPQLVVVVFVEHGGSGSGAAAPIAKAIYEKYFGIDSDRPGA